MILLLSTKIPEPHKNCSPAFVCKIDCIEKVDCIIFVSEILKITRGLKPNNYIQKSKDWLSNESDYSPNLTFTMVCAAITNATTSPLSLISYIK